MAGGLAALLDDVAMIAKMASAAGTKAVTLVVDDTAVTPQYVTGFSPKRELPIIWKISKGSLLNKAILIVLLLIIDHFLPPLLTVLLMCGGLYLSFEGAEKVIEALKHPVGDPAKEPVANLGASREKQMVKSAITTDFILSAEIMVISLDTVNSRLQQAMPFYEKAAVLAVVAIIITALVYGAVALLVKMDDIGFALKQRDAHSSQRLGRILVAAMPKVLAVLSAAGLAAMLWVGGHILLAGSDKLGWHQPFGLVHRLSDPAQRVAGVGAVLAWLIETACSAVVALAIGALLTGVVNLLPIHRDDPHRPHDGPETTPGQPT